jgi:hypothetical protein
LNFNLNKKLGNFLTLIFSYGVGPMLVSFIFYCLINFFPERSDFFYLLSIIVIFSVPLAIFYKDLKKILIFHKNILCRLSEIVDFKSKKKLLFGSIILFVFIIYSIQALVYPIVDNDNVLYINQAKAFYKFKNTDWQKEASVIINQNDRYIYNPSIQPALPVFLAASFILGKDIGNYFSFQFLYFYYFIWLIAVFSYLIYFVNNRKKDSFHPVYCGILFFIFSSALARVLMYNAKESAVYFFGIFSLVLVLKLLQSKIQKQNLILEILLGSVLGLASFVSFHGVAIELIMLLIVLIFLKRNLKEKILSLIFIFLSSFLFGYSQFIFVWKFLVATFAKILSTFSEHMKLNSENYKINSNVLSVSNENGKLPNAYISYESFYQMNSLKDIYLKGKLQILTNVGYFGFYFWFFIYVLVNKYKKIVADDKLKVVVTFIGLYFLIMIDPFNFNIASYSIVLWGSPKYAVFLLMLGLVPLSIYAENIIEKVTNFFRRFGMLVFPLLIIFSLASLFFLDQINSVLLKTLFSIIQVYKETSFYENITRVFLLSEILAILTFSILGLVAMIRNFDKDKYLVMAVMFFVFILTPFLATNIGKVPLSKTFNYLREDNQKKLEEVLYEGDIYKIYFQAKKMLPEKTELATDFNEIYAYNDYFSLVGSKYGNNAEYKILRECGDWKILYQTKKTKLCSKY